MIIASEYVAGGHAMDMHTPIRQRSHALVPRSLVLALALLGALSLADLITSILLIAGGFAVEVNPLMRAAIPVVGLSGVIALKAVITVGCLTVMFVAGREASRRFARMAWVACITYALVWLAGAAGLALGLS